MLLVCFTQAWTSESVLNLRWVQVKDGHVTDPDHNLPVLIRRSDHRRESFAMVTRTPFSQ